MQLNGERIVITRSRTAGEKMAAQVVEMGGQPLLCPAIATAPMPDMAPLDEAIRTLDKYDWLIFTSGNAVNVFFDRYTAVTGIDLPVAERMLKPLTPDLHIAAVGTKTTMKIQDLGVCVDFVPKEFISANILSGLGPIVSRRFLLPQSNIARQELTDGLRSAGGVVDAVPAYRTVIGDPTAEELAAVRSGVDVVTFTSPSTFRNFTTLLGDDAAAVLNHAAIACIGPTTAAAVTEAGYAVDMVPREHTADGLLGAIPPFFK